MNNLKKAGKILIIVAFIVLSILVANKHEHWSDEAQSYLLARDTSLSELLGYMKYEGTPALWVMVIKLFLFLGGTYETFYILPIICTAIGLIIFEFKIKAPWYIKILFPFTYFVFYQYTIVARSYCLVFPLLMILAVIYEKRFEKPILYSIVLFFFMSISLHTLVISGSLYLIFLIEIFKDKKYKDKKIIIACVLIFFELLFTAICTFPASDCSYGPGGGKSIIKILSEITIGSNYDTVSETIITAIVVAILILFFKEKDKFEIIKFLILFVPVSLIYIFVVYQIWHIGVLCLLMFTYFIVNNQINENEFIKFFLLFVCIVQIYWSVSSTLYDWNNNYSGSKDAAEFIKSLDYEDKKIYGFGYGVTALQPYFNENIFDNYNTEKAFYFWKKDKGYMTDEETLEKPADIYVVAQFNRLHHLVLYGSINQNNEYVRYDFNAHTYLKNYGFENEGYYVYVRKDLLTEK